MADTPAHLPAREPDDDLDLRSVVQADHAAINDAFQAATAVEPRQNEPRRQLIAADGFLAILSRHVTAVEDILYPAMRQLPDGRETAQFCLHCTDSARHQLRELELSARHLIAELYGEAHETAPYAELWQRIAARLAWHVSDEEALCKRLDDALPEPQRRRIAVAFVHTFDRAPTRPHPYTPHSRRLGRAMHRIFSVVDRAMDVMDSRITPQKPVAPRPVKRTLWGQYLIGTPDVPDELPAEPDQGTRP
jgi:hypothetical protein